MNRNGNGLVADSTVDDSTVRQVILDLLVAEGHTGRSGVITAQTSLAEGGLELTSLELVRLLVSVEERLDVELDDATIMNAHFDTVEDIVTLVAGALVGQAG